MNEAQIPIKGLWYCDMCEKETSFTSRVRHIKCNTHTHEGKFSIIVKDYEIIEPEIHEVGYIFDDVI